MAKIPGSTQHDPADPKGFGRAGGETVGYNPNTDDWSGGGVETTGDTGIVKSIDLGGTPARNTTLGGAETQNDKPEPNSETWGIGLGEDAQPPTGGSYRHTNRAAGSGRFQKKG